MLLRHLLDCNALPAPLIHPSLALSSSSITLMWFVRLSHAGRGGLVMMFCMCICLLSVLMVAFNLLLPLLLMLCVCVLCCLAGV